MCAFSPPVISKPLSAVHPDLGAGKTQECLPCLFRAMPSGHSLIKPLSSALDPLSSQQQKLNPAWLCNPGEKCKSLKAQNLWPTQVQVLKDVSSEACLLKPISVPAAFGDWASHMEVKTVCNRCQASSFSLTYDLNTFFPHQCRQKLEIFSHGTRSDHMTILNHQCIRGTTVLSLASLSHTLPLLPTHPTHPPLPVPSRAHCCSQWPCPCLLT